MQYFVDFVDHVEYFDTSDQAKKAAQAAIDEYRDCCDPGWPEEVENVRWGVVLGQVEARRCGDDNEFVEYDLTDSPMQWRCTICGGLVIFDGKEVCGLDS